MKLVPYLLAGAVILFAAAILVRRVRALIKTRGMSACRHCPYSGNCSKREERGAKRRREGVCEP